MYKITMCSNNPAIERIFPHLSSYIDILPHGKGLQDVLVIHKNIPISPMSTKILLLNADMEADPEATAEISAQSLITYGHNAKSCITFSSISESNFCQICLQRSIPKIGGGILEPQEFAVSANQAIQSQDMLAAVSLALVCGVKYGKNMQNLP